MNGLLLVDKPSGITSFGVVDRLKKEFGLRRVGHGGTLDPLATGLLVVLIGAATKTARVFLEGDKIYLADLLLGRETDTQDVAGELVKEKDYVAVGRRELEEALNLFRGEIEQVPPMVSALKYHGRRLYELARQGKEVFRPPRRVVVKELKLVEFLPPVVRLLVRSSKGTYLRTLCHDLGKKLGCGGCLSNLRRLASGSFRVEDALPLSRLLELDRRGLTERLVFPPAPASASPCRPFS